MIASLVYLRYSKRKYLKFYRLFNRFAMKCFLHEALMYWRHAAGRCVIDNTNLARLRGTGKHAVIVPEMISFGRQYGFEFICHAIGHANRKERTKVASSHRESPKRRNADSLISPTSFNPREFALEIALTDQF